MSYMQLLRDGEQQLRVRRGCGDAAQAGPRGQNTAVQHCALQRCHIYDMCLLGPAHDLLAD